MKKILALIISILIINTMPVFAKTDRTSAEYLKNKKHFALMNPIAESTAQRILKKALKKEVGDGDYKVKFSAYTLSSLRKGIFKSIEIQGKDLEIEEIPVQYIKVKTLTDYNWIDITEKPVKIKSDMIFGYEMELTEKSINKALEKKDYQKVLENLITLAKDCKLDEKIKEMIKDIANYRHANYPIPLEVKDVLREYQVNAFNWLKTLVKYKFCGILADDMGLGKTLEIISLVLSDEEIKPSLIVSPKSLIYNWQNEFKKWAPNVNVKVISGNADERKDVISTINNSENTIYITSYDSLRNDLENYNNTLITSSTTSHNILLTINHFLKYNETVIYVAPNLYKATIAYETICDLIGMDNVNFYVTDEVVAVEALAISNEFKFERMHTIASILKNKPNIIVTYISSFTRPLIPLDIYKDNVINVKVNSTIDVNKLIKKLVIMGYKRTPSTQQTGDFSVRGEIIDIYAINNNQPYRIGLFDDEVEYIKTFDPNTQMSINKTNEIDIYPINELLYEYDDSITNNLLQDVCNNDVDKDLFENDIESLKSYINNDVLYKYIKYIYK